MAYIQPNTSIWLLKGINWSPNYDDTVYFANKSVQYNYMKNKAVKTYEAQSYQRHSKNSLRILDTADKLYECNYLMFQNTSYGNKWFYAFITDIEYINDNTTEITYEIDIIQTWLWDLELGECFVEREIPVTDGLYENLVAENLETGDYILGANNRYSMNEDPYYLIATTTDTSGIPIVGEVNGISCPLHYMKLPVSAGASTLQAIIDEYYKPPNNPDNIINIQIVPKNIALAAVPNVGETGSLTEDYIKIPRLYALDGYSPKNNKLLTAPYSYLYATNNVGQGAIYKWEDFAGTNDVEFYILGCALGTASITAYPEWHRGRAIDYDSGLSLTNFPPIPWVCDTYKAYLAQNKATITTSILTSAISSLVGFTSSHSSNSEGNTSYSAGSLVRGGANIASTLAQLEDRKTMPKTISTMAQNDMLMLLSERLQFDFYHITIKHEMAKIIDDYFSAYGYAQHKIKVPNINARKSWSYVQTKGCILKGSCPSSIKANISSIFDKGIRFWQSNEIVGDYSRDNSP